MFLWAQSTELSTSLHNSVCVHSYHISPLSKTVHLIMFDRALSVIHIIPQVSLLCTTLAHTRTELLITLVFYRYLMKSPKLKALFTIKFLIDNRCESCLLWMQKLVQGAALQPIRSCTRELKLAIKVADYISVMEIGKFYISHKKVVNGHNGGVHF